MTTPTPSARMRIELLESIAFVAVEFERELDLARLTNLIDLYARFLRDRGEEDDRPEFEAFVNDRHALAEAALLVQCDSGVPTLAPMPLRRMADPA